MARDRDRWKSAVSSPFAVAAAVTALSALAHVEVLGYWFTGTDTLTLIETSRARSLGEAAALFVRPLMAGSAFAENALFYRPIASLSYAVDYAVWGTTPFGYHLTDLLLHAGATLLVFLLVREVAGGEARRASRIRNAAHSGDVAVASLAALLFGLHPLTVEVVPTPARRQDVLATAFVLLSLLLFVRGVRDRRRPLAVASAVAYLLALGSKETAAALPALAAIWYVADSFRRGVDLRAFLARGVEAFLPLAVATVGYLAVRIAVLGGVGGYVGRAPRQVPAARIVTRYVRSLLYPVDVIELRFGDGVAVVPDGVALLAAIGLLLGVAAAVRAGGIRPLVRSRSGVLLLTFGLWPAVPLALFVGSGRYAVRSGYFSLPAVAAVLAALSCAAARGLLSDRGRTESRDGDGDGDRDRGRSRDALAVGSRALTLALAGALALSLLAGSPLVQPYGAWEHASDVSEGTLTTVEGEVEAAPNGSTVVVADLPHARSVRRVTDRPRPISVTYVWANSVDSWLELRYPEREFDVRANGTTTLTHERVDVRATTDAPRPGVRVVRLRYDPAGETAPNRTQESFRFGA